MLRKPALVVLFLTAFLLTNAGCVSKKSGEQSKQDKAQFEKFVVDKAPDGIQELNIKFEDKLTLLGYKTNAKGTVKPNQQMSVTLYWRVDKELGEPGWGVFTHLHDAAGKRVANVDTAGPLRRMEKKKGQAFGPSSWKAGKVIVDELNFAAPKKNTTNALQVVAGIWKGNKRLSVTAGPKLSNDQGLVVKLDYAAGKSGKKRSTKVPQLQANRVPATVQLKIDGKLDEEAWKDAASTGPFVNVRTGDPDEASPVQGSVRVLWNEKNLFLGFEVKDSNIVGGFDKAAKDPQLWTKDTVEVMIDPDGDGDNKDYYEIQVGPQNLVFDSQFDEYNKPKTEPNGPFGHQDWSAKLESAVVIDGTLDKSDDKDTGYTVEIRLPWSSFSKAKKLPPELGQQWRVNFYAMQDNSGVAWSPILGQGNFHKASRFGKITWAEKGWKAPDDKKGDKQKDDAKGDDKEGALKKASQPTGTAGAPNKGTVSTPAPAPPGSALAPKQPLAPKAP
jgi:hypothetical protein